MRLIRLVLYLLISCLFIGGLHAASQANQTSVPTPVVKAPRRGQAMRALKPKPSDVQKQIQELTSEIAILEQSLALRVVQDNPILKTPRIKQWVDDSCRLQTLLLLHTSKGTADPQMLAEIESECMENKRQEAADKFRAIPPPVQKAVVPVQKNEPATKADAEKANTGSSDGGSLKLSASAEASRKQAAIATIGSNSFQRVQQADDKPCNQKDKLCVTLDWAQKPTTSMPLRKSGDYRFHAVNLNDILYDYTMTGEAPTLSTDDLSLFANLIKETQTSLLSAASAGTTTDTSGKAHSLVTECPLADHLLAANSQADALSKAITDLQPQATDKKYASILLRDTRPRAEAIFTAFQAFRQPVVLVQSDIAALPISNKCTEEWVVAASKLITEQYPKIRSQVDKLDERYHRSHTQDQEFHCEQTIGCSMTIQESYAGSPTTATPNPWKATLQATLSQLTLSGGFLLTELQARSYSSRTAPDPTAPTTKTVNVLGVDYSSGVRPALTALFNYHLPFPNTDWPKNGFALSAGPVIDVSNGKADTSRFGFFGGISAHIWNRFWITPGIHVGEFADTPQGFKGPGDIIPPNSGTPTPVKRYTARFAIAITFQGGNPAAVIGEKKTDTTNTPSSGTAASNK